MRVQTGGRTTSSAKPSVKAPNSGRMALALVSTSVLLILAMACSTETPPIVFTSDRDGNLEIYAVSVENKEVQNLTQTATDEFSPVMSPDGQLIAFRSGPEQNASLETMGANGGDRQQLVNGAGSYYNHRWAPGEARLAFIRTLAEQRSLYVINADGTHSMTLTSIPADDIGTWSPDGRSVLFSVRLGPRQGIYIRNPEGVNEFRVTNTPDYGAVWSPDGRRIAFLSDRDGNPEIYVMNTDGTDQKRLSNSNALEYGLSWSPDGNRLLFVSERDGNAEIYLTDGDGSFLQRLTHNEVADEQAVWSPDGTRIAFVSFLDGDSEIFYMGADGSEQVRLTNNISQDTHPSW